MKCASGRVGRHVALATVAATAVAILALLIALEGGGARKGPARQVKLPQAEVTITSGGGWMSVPDSFLGLSTEYWALPLFERQMSVLETVLSAVHVQGAGPQILRIGGDSADCTFWEPAVRRMPQWIFQLTPDWLRQASTVVRRAGVRLILDLNLITGTPRTDALLAEAAEKALPRGSILGFEIGNEPDLYSRRYWLATILPLGGCAKVLPSEISASAYANAFKAYERVLRVVAPSVPLAGPALSDPAFEGNWISKLLAAAPRGLGIVSAHLYPYSACVAPSSARYPTIPRLLSDNASAGMAQTVRAAVRLAHRAGLTFRLTELNSVTCGGEAGVSDTFATALWAPDALFELLHAGVDGVNVHVQPDLINAAFTLTGDGLRARPLLYGLILFARTLGPDAQLVHVRLHGKASLPLKVWAVRVSGGGLHVLLIDKSNRSVSVDLQLPATGPATVQRLSAPSVMSRSDVTLDGQQLDADGHWEGKRSNETIAPGINGYTLTIPRLSAALVAVHLPPGALTPGIG
jgi:Glycosyl hydrolase family 79 C-terminal beta domain